MPGERRVSVIVPDHMHGVLGVHGQAWMPAPADGGIVHADWHGHIPIGTDLAIPDLILRRRAGLIANPVHQVKTPRGIDRCGSVRVDRKFNGIFALLDYDFFLEIDGPGRKGE